MKIKTDTLAGITVALALFPEALAFSILAGVPPMVGVTAVFVVGTITALFGGKPGMISGAAGAVAVGLGPLVKAYGLEYLFATVVLAGMLQLFFALCRLDRILRFISLPVNWGFMNGLAVLIFVAQLSHFKTADPAGPQWLSSVPLGMKIGLTAASMLIMRYWSKLTNKLPGALVAIVGGALIVWLFNLPARTVGDMTAVEGRIPTFHIANVPPNWETVVIIFPYALVMAGVGLIESLLTLDLIADRTGTQGNGKREIVAQGIANCLSGTTGGMGGCAMVGQSLINLEAGGRSRLSGIVAALSFLILAVFGSFLIERVPLASLTGVMFIIAFNTFNWKSITQVRHYPVPEFLMLVLVTGITIFTGNLALAVLIGIAVSLLGAKLKRYGSLISLIRSDNADGQRYELHGDLFFANVHRLGSELVNVRHSSDLTLDLRYGRILDMTGARAVFDLARLFHQHGGRLQLIHIAEDDIQLLCNTARLFQTLNCAALFKSDRQMGQE
ncbi:MAG: SulP family inorganic anion transporter [Mucilaginibacter sp.]|nr:SulP family inorganic anion transporter [Mucilaginibacter sp.]